MKVINSWDSPEEPTMNSRCADCNYADCRCDRPPMPAANPWRYDVENAPKDGSEVLLAWKWLNNIQVDRLFWSETDGFWTDGSGIRCCIMHHTVIAFATINPPEIDHDHP